jgi:hypothetical protein
VATAGAPEHLAEAGHVRRAGVARDAGIARLQRFAGRALAARPVAAIIVLITALSVFSVAHLSAFSTSIARSAMPSFKD